MIFLKFNLNQPNQLSLTVSFLVVLTVSIHKMIFRDPHLRFLEILQI